MGRLSALLLTLALIPGIATPAERIDAGEAMALSEAAVGGQVRDYALVDRGGEPLRLASLRGRPLVVSIVYTACGSVCPPTTQTVIGAVEEARAVFGPGRFGVLTLGFDARGDSPARLEAFAREQRIPDEDWRVASADAATLKRLLADLGFSYSAGAGGFDHITQTTLLDADHRVYRQVYGEYFPVQVFLEPLKELVWGVRLKDLTAQSLIDRIRYICTTYNPADGAYRFDYGIAFGIVLGGLSLILSGIVVVRLWISNRRLERAGRQP